MPLKFDEIINRTKKIEVDLDGECLSLEIRAGFYTPAIAAKINSADDAMAAQLEIMAGAIVWWDFEQDGVGVPVSVETLSALSVQGLNAIFSAMMEAVFPNPQKADS